MNSRWLFRAILVFKFRVPLQVQNCIFVSFADADVAALWVKDVPDEHESVAAGARKIVAALAKLRAKHIPLVACEFYCC